MKKLGKILGIVLCLVMVLSMLPVGAAAASNWTEVQLSAITSTDKIAIVQVTSDEPMAMLNNDNGGPATAWTTSTTATNDMLWTFESTTGGYYIKSASDSSKYLYSTNTNNGIKVGTTKGVWTTNTYGTYTYLTTTTTDGLRTMGFTAQNNFRAYTLNGSAVKDAVKNQNVKFYKWTGSDVSDTRQDLPTQSDKIVDAIFALQKGEALSKYYKYSGDIELTGTVTGTPTWSDEHSNGTVNFKVKDSTGAERTMQAYKLVPGGSYTKEDIKGLASGDTITVKGATIKRFNDTFEFDGCTLTNITKGADTRQDLPTETNKIVDAIYALGNNETLDMYYKPAEFTLTGVVTVAATWDTTYSNGQLTFKVNGKEIVAWRASAGTYGADAFKALKVGDTVTFKATAAKNYSGTYELEYPTLVGVEQAPAGSTPTGTTATNPTGTQNPDSTGDSTGAVSMVAIMLMSVTAVVALVVGNKKRMF